MPVKNDFLSALFFLRRLNFSRRLICFFEAPQFFSAPHFFLRRASKNQKNHWGARLKKIIFAIIFRMNFVAPKTQHSKHVKTLVWDIGIYFMPTRKFINGKRQKWGTRIKPRKNAKTLQYTICVYICLAEWGICHPGRTPMCHGTSFARKARGATGVGWGGSPWVGVEGISQSAIVL